MGNIGSLIMHLKMDGSVFEKELEKAVRSSNDFGTFIGHASKAAAVGIAAVTAAAAGVATGLLAVTKSAAAVGDELSKASEKTGVSAEILSGFRFAAELSDVSMQELGMSLGKLARLQNDAATGTKTAQDTFKQLGLQFKEADGTLRPLNDIMLDASDKLAGLKDSTQRAALAQELFGKSGINMLPLLNQGSDAIREQMLEAQQLGVVWTNDAAKGAEVFNDSLTRLGFAAEGFKNDVAQILIPVLTEVSEGVLKWVKANREWLKDEIQRDVNALVSATKSLVSVMGTVVKTSIDIKNSSFTDYLILGLKALGYVVVSTFTVMIGMLEQFALNITRLGAKLPDMLGGSIFQGHAKTLEEMLAKNQHQLKLYTEQIAIDFGLMSKNSVGHLDVMTKKAEQTAQAVKKIGHSAKTFTVTQGPNQDAAAQDFYAAERELFLGKLIVEESMERYRQTIAQGKAEEHLGGIIFARFQREQEIAKQTADLQHSLMLEHLSDRSRTITLIEEEASLRAKFVRENVEDETKRIALLEGIERTSSMKLSAIKIEDQRKELELFEELRKAAMTAEEAQRFEIEKTAESRRTLVMQTIKDAQMQALSLENIEVAKVNQLNAIAGQHTNFWTEQLAAIKQSAAFTWSSIVQGFSNAMAGMIEGTSTWSEFMKAMQHQLLVSFLNLGVQMTAAFLIEQAHQLAIATGFEAARTSASTVGAVSRVTVATAESASLVATNTAGNAAIVTGNAVAATASASIWTGAGTTILGMFGAVAGGFKALALSMVATVKAVGTFIMSVLSSIAAAMKATVFGIPVGIAILAGVAAIAVALAATGNIPGLAEGGIVTGPTMAQVGEGGSPETVIPLNDRGARFMQSAMGFGSNGTQVINLNVDKKLLTRIVVKGMPDVVHTKLGYT
jgi:hypothetical protein